MAAHTREADDWDSPAGRGVQLGLSRSRRRWSRVEQQVGAGTSRRGWQSDFGRDIERPRNNSRTVRFYYPTEDSHRFTADYDASRRGRLRARWACTPSSAATASVTDQDRFATATTGAQHRARRHLGQRLPVCAATASGCSASPRSRCGVDVNGRFGLQALDDPDRLQPGRRHRQHAAERVDRRRRAAPTRRCIASVDTALASVLSLAGGRARRLRHHREPGRLLRRSVDRQRRRLRLRGPHGRQLRRLQLTAAGGARLPRPDAVGPLLPRPHRPRLHHRQPRSRAGDQPAVRRRACATPRRGTGWPPTTTTTASTTSSSATRPRVDNFFFRNRGSARIRGFEVEGQAELGAGFSLDLATQVAEGRAARRRRLPGRHLADQPDDRPAQDVRRARIRPGAAGVLLGRRAQRADRTASCRATRCSTSPAALTRGHTPRDSVSRRATC